MPLMLDEGVESHSDGVHRIHWTRIDFEKSRNRTERESPSHAFRIS